MILHWKQILLYYGSEVDAHQSFLERAGQTTYALLLCRWAPTGEQRLASHQGVHAEQRLLQTPLWTQEIPNALESWSLQDHHPIIITMALNRTPCVDCAAVLTDSLNRLEWKFAMRFQHTRFVLACRGYYQGDYLDPVSGQIRTDRVTTDRALKQLQEAGWEVCVLQFADRLPDRGQELLNFLDHQPGRRSAIVRLSR